jgi:8-oxo-dGTP pyrophosphatase MutT (NUDIX family)
MAMSEWLEMIEELESDGLEVARCGRTYQPDPTRGDGYWCGVHGVAKCRCELRRWGKFGAAGVLFFHRESQRFLLNERSHVIHHGGTWSTLGGALDRDESALEGALREASEECGEVPEDFELLAEVVSTTHGIEGSWTYSTFAVEVTEAFKPEAGDWESAGSAWLTLSEIATRKLHPGFRQTFPVLVAEMYAVGAFRQEVGR